VLTASLWLGLFLSAAPLPCDGPAAKGIESGEFFHFAVAHWGAPSSCTAKLRNQGAQVFGTWTWRFKGGVTFTHDSSPPEYLVDAYSFDKGLDDSQVVDGLFALDAIKQVSIHAQGKPELDVDADAGTTTERHWSSDTGFNAAIDVVRKAGKVVTLRFHIAL
jgi:hypothetical protein